MFRVASCVNQKICFLSLHLYAKSYHRTYHKVIKCSSRLIQAWPYHTTYEMIILLYHNELYIIINYILYIIINIFGN